MHPLRAGHGGLLLEVLGDAFLSPHLEQGDEEDEQHEHPGDSRGVAHAVEGEPGFVHVEGEHGGGLTGTALGHDVDQREDLEGADDAGYQEEEGGWPEQREDDVGELLPAVGAVDLRGFVEFLGNALQTCQVDDHVVSQPCPQADDHHGGHSPLHTASPLGRVLDADCHQEGVDRTEGGVKDDQPDGGNRNGAGDVGHEDHGAQNRFEIAEIVEDDCKEQTYCHADRHDQGEDQVVLERPGKPGVGGEGAEVLEPNDLQTCQTGDEVPIGEGKEEGKDDRKNGENGIDQKVGSNEEIGGERFTAGKPAHALAPGGERYLDGCHWFYSYKGLTGGTETSVPPAGSFF